MSNIKLKNLYVCENVIVAFNGQLSLINLTSEITSTAFPALHPKLTVLVSITGDEKIYDEKIEIMSISDNKIIAVVNGKAEIKEQGGNNFIANFINIIFPQEGKYWIKVSVGDDIITNKEENFILLKQV